MSASMVEQVAKAIWLDRYPSWKWEADFEWKAFSGRRSASRRRALADALIAIKAMRKPTPGMFSAGNAQIAYHIRPIDNVAPTWTAMIDAAFVDSKP